MITIKQYDDLRKEIQHASLSCTVRGYRLTLGLTKELFNDLLPVMTRIERKYNEEYLLYDLPVCLIDGTDSQWVLYIVKGEVR